MPIKHCPRHGAVPQGLEHGCIEFEGDSFAVFVEQSGKSWTKIQKKKAIALCEIPR
jgi:hypothetical protein